MGKNIQIAVFFLLAWLPVFVVAEERSVNPGINSYYYGASHEEWVPVFESSSREVYAKRHKIVTALDIKPGMRIADIGAGTGFYTLLFAEKAGPEGVVYAVDIARDFINAIEEKAQLAGHTNITGIVNNGRDAGLEPQSIDLAFICDTYHHFEYPLTTMRSIYRALSPQGEVVIIDFRKAPDIASAWVQQHVRAGRDEIIEEMRAAGFELLADLPLLRTNYFLRFRKRQ